VPRRSGTVHRGRVLVRLAGTVARQHGGLLVGGRGAAMCGTGMDVSVRSGPMGAYGSLQ
jgi:hypothetical protein